MLLVVISPSKDFGVSLSGRLISFAGCLVLYFILMVYPLIRKAKLMGQIVYNLQIKDNYCYFDCKSIFKSEHTSCVYNLSEISIGEKEVFQEKFFKTERFLVLDVEDTKLYLIGQALSQYESVLII
ncbi:hypothetical protein [Pedobacter sp. UYP30]|uniref:hypothetical protein n=1 Tax=Pedobacter sp. UYP30 TaxID=1756400 RepID=UPI003394F64C